MDNCKEMLMPVLFLAHGNPMYVLQDNIFTQSWQELGSISGNPPKAIVVISAHCLTRQHIRIGTHLSPPTIHDFGGFPPAMYQLQYSCAGNPQLAKWIMEQLPEFDWQADANLGLDHGAWSVLMKLYPEANVPVVPISMDIAQNPQWHYKLAKKLKFLRSEGVLVVCSGNIVHNLRRFFLDPNGPFNWAVEFDQQVWDAVQNRDHEALQNYLQWGEAAKESVPTIEHYLPLLYAVGLSEKTDMIKSTQFDPVSLEMTAMRSIRFGD